MAAQTAAIQYQLEHWGDDRGPAIIAGSVVLVVVTAIAVALRLVAQKMIKTKFDVDDYLIVVAMVRLYLSCHLLLLSQLGAVPRALCKHCHM
jgi:hypothetical protein